MLLRALLCDSIKKSMLSKSKHLSAMKIVALRT